jgi:hypothetical protein
MIVDKLESPYPKMSKIDLDNALSSWYAKAGLSSKKHGINTDPVNV